MEKIFTDIEKNTRPLPQILLEVKYKTNHFKMDLQDSIDLTDGYVIGVTSFNTYNSIFNVTSENNKIIYFDELLYCKEFVLPPGAYEIEQINDEIARHFASESFNNITIDSAPIKLEANTATLRSIIRLSDGYKVDLTQTNTLRDLSGFESVILSDIYNYSKNKVNIIDIHRLHLWSDCIIGSLRNGYPSNILFTIVLNESPGAKIVREPNLILYKHIYKQKLDSIEFWMEDDDGNQIDNNGETISFTLHMKKNS